MPFVMQGSLFGGPPVVSGNVVDRLEYILTEHPEARDSYKAAMALYWLEFDGLDAALRQALPDTLDAQQADDMCSELAGAFQKWFERFATSPKTLQNRAMELQSDKTELDSSPDVRKWRDRQSRAGRIK